MRRDYLSIRVSILLAVAIGLMATPALALVQHPNTADYPNSEEPPVMSDRPVDAVVGWWNYNASAVAIKPNYIITTCHQGGGVGTTVNFGGVDYRVAEVFQHSKADLRIARIVNPTTGADADLTNVGYYKDTDEEDKTAVIGGFGYGRGTAYPTYYTYAETNNKTERWGQNYIEGTGSTYDPSGFSTQLLTANFDNYGAGNWVNYEACVAPYDSGGGWFLKDGVTGSWQVVGLSRVAAPSSFNPAAYMDCVRVSSYATWLNNAFSRSTWNPSSGGDWSTSTNWSGGVPTGLDKWAVFSDKVPDSRMVTLDASHTIGTLRFDCLGGLTIAAGGSSKLTFEVTNSADSAQIETGNTNGSGALTITAPVTMGTSLVVRHNSGGTLTISGKVTGTGKSLTKAGTGTLVLSGANTYTGATTVFAGTLQFAKQVSLYNNNPASWTAANLVVASGATAAFNVGGTGEFTAANINTLKALGTSTGGFKSGAILGLDTASGDFPYSSAIGNPNGGANILGLRKLGANTLTLSGASTYTGATSVSGGILKAGIASSPGVSGAFGKNSAVTLANTAGVSMDLNGFNTQIGSLAGGGVTGGNVILGAATLTVGGNNASPTAYAGVISGTGGALTKIGAGALTLSGDNTYTGGTMVSEGTLLVSNTAGSATGTGPVTVDAATLGGTGFINGPVTLTGDSTLTSTGTLTINGTLTVQDLANQLAAGTVLTSDDVTIEPGAVFIINGTLGGEDGSLIVRGTLMGKGTINKTCILEAGGVLSPGAPSTIQGMAQILNAQAPRNFSFEIGAATPNYATPSNSVNDVIRLTDAATPFADATGAAPAAFTADTVIDVYFLSADPALGEYKAEFFAATDFSDAVAGATYQYWHLDPHGSRYHNGNLYSPLDESLVDWSVVPETANFVGGEASGYITELTVVPEPVTALLLGAGALALVARRRRLC